MHAYAKHYLCSLGIVLVAMLLYRGLLVPAIEPSRADQPEPFVHADGVQTTQWWQRLFPANGWQQDHPKVLQTPRGILLFKNWTPLGPDQWRLEPLTMIIPQSQSRGESASGDGESKMLDQDVLIVYAEHGAVIQFREALDWTKGKTPPVVGGRLEGQIHITRRAKAAGGDKPWHLTTSDVQIDRRRVWTVNPVEIHWDNSVIRGRDLSIFLKQDLLSDASDDASPWGVLENMELIYIDEISVGLPPGGLWADMKPTSPELPVTQGLPARLKVESGGPFRFDFIGSQATLMNGVKATHELGSLPPDQFSSQEVQVTLVPTTPTAGAAPPVSAKTSITLGGLQLKNLTARGMDPVGPITGQQIVQLNAPNIGVSARAKRLNVNFVDQQLELSGRLEGPQAATTVAALDYLGYSFRSPLIQYRQAPDSKHLGWLAAEGPGELMVAGSDKLGPCNVRWQQAMHMKPDGEEQWVSLVGQTLIESKIHGIMTADVLDVWLKPNPDAADAPAAAKSTSNKRSLTTATMLPDRLRAEGDVSITSPQIKANVEKLNLWLVHAAVGTQPANDGLKLSDSAGNPMYQFLGPPQQNVADSNANSSSTADANTNASEPAQSGLPGISPNLSMPIAAAPDIKSSGPIHVKGSVFQSTIILANNQSWIDSLTIDGPLTVWGSPTPNNPNPWNTVGDQLQLSTNAAGQANVQIVGKPCKIAMGEAWLEGPVIRYDQASGFIWMDQPGEFSIPTTALNRAAGKESSGKADDANALQWLKAPHCKWDGRMLFDGSVAHIEGDIKLSGMVTPQENRFWLVEGECKQMEVHLSNPINLQAPKAATASLDRVVLKDSVQIQAAQNDSQGNRVSLQQISVPTLTYHLSQSQLVGAGPGWIRSWHLASAQLGQMASSSATRTVPVQEIQGAHLIFRQSLIAFMDRSEVVLEGKVEVAAGPLKSWDDRIDLNTMQHLKQDEMTLTCDLLKAYDTNGFAPRVSSMQQPMGSWEFQSLGNVRFAGKSDDGDYSGNGYRVTYTQSKDLLVLEGDGRTPAHLRKQPLPSSGQQILEADVISAAINVKTLETPVLRLTRVSASQPSAPNPSGSLGPATGNSIPLPSGTLGSPASPVDPRKPKWMGPKQ